MINLYGKLILNKGGLIMAINISNRKPNLNKRIRSHALNTTNSTQASCKT